MNSLATSLIRAVFLAVLSSFLLPDSLFAQGSLTPPGAPTPTMKTLVEVEPRIAVQTLAGDANTLFLISQPGSYYLTGNINGGSGKSAIAISADDVTLDLCGHALIGLAGATFGVDLRSARSRVVVRNGSIRTFNSGGVNGPGARGCLVENVSVRSISAGGGILITGDTNLARNCNVSTVGGSGIALSSSSSAENCVVDNVIGFGFTVGISAGTVRNSAVIVVNTTTGDATGINGNSVSNCRVKTVIPPGNGNGINADSVTDCSVDTVSGFNSIGIRAIGGQVSGCAVINIATGASDAAASAFGISTESAANCSVIGVGSAASIGNPIGILAKSATNCAVAQVGQTTSSVGAIGFSATTVTGCYASSIRGGSNGNVLGISGSVITNSNVDTLSQASSNGIVTALQADTVIGCRATGIAGSNGQTVVGIGASSLVRDCTVSTISNAGSGSAMGLFRSSSNAGSVENCVFRSCGTIAISVVSRQRIVGCTISGTTTSGILATGVRNVIDGNTLDNVNTGINAASGGTANSLIIRNQIRNCTTNIAADGPCQVGPIVSAAGIIASTNPWANFTD